MIFSALFAAIIYRWISLERLQHAAPLEVIATPTPSPTRPPLITGKLDTAKLFNGITLHSTVETIPGADASTERAEPDSYKLDLKLQARVPSPNKTIEDLAKVSPIRFRRSTLSSTMRKSECYAKTSLGSIFFSRGIIFSIAKRSCSFSIRKRTEKRSCSREIWT